jgi:WD40 repeat protein/Flp pilus assembly protein TadD
MTRDSHWLVTGTYDKEARLWDLTAEDPEATVRVLRRHEDAIYKMAISPDDHWLVTGSADKTARLWDLTAEDPQATARILGGHENAIHSIHISPGGHWLVTGSADKTARLWDLTYKDPESTARVLRGHDGDFSLMAVSPDEHWLVTGSFGDPVPRAWDLTVEEPAAAGIVARGPRFGSIAISPDDRWLLARHGNQKLPLQLWDLRSEDPASTATALRGHTGRMWFVAWSADGQRLATACDDQTVRLWDLTADDPAAKATVLHRIEYRGNVRSVALSPDGHWLAAGSTETAEVEEAATARLWDLRADDPAATERVLRGHEDRVRSVAFSPDGHWLATGSADKTVRLWDLTQPDPSSAPTVLPGEGGVSVVAFSPNGRWLLTREVMGRGFKLRLWDRTAKDRVATPRVLRADEAANRASFAFAFGPDSHWLVTMTFPTSENPGRTEHLPAAVELWDLDAENPTAMRHVLRETHSRMIVFSRDGHWLVTGGNRTAHLWDLTAEDPAASPRLLLGHRVVDSAAFSPDGRWLATAGLDGTTRLWDVAGPDPAASAVVLRGHEHSVRTVAFTADGAWLLTAGDDTTVRRWDMRLDRLVDVAERQAGRELTHLEARQFDLPLTMRQQAQTLVDSIRTRFLLKADLIEAIRKDATIGEDLRQHSLAAAERFVEDPGRLNEGAWALVRRPAATAVEQRRALRLAQAASKLQPDDVTYLTTLGVVQYRLGQYDSASVTLTRADELYATRKGFIPVHLSFLAMAYQKLGRKEQAHSALGRLRGTMREVAWSRDSEAWSFLREAENLVYGEDAIQNAKRLHAASWAVVRTPNRTADEYRQALLSAEAANRLKPENPVILRTIGVTRYRLGEYEEALSTLATSDDLYPRSQPANLAFMAMAQYQLGQKDQAKITVARLQKAMKHHVRFPRPDEHDFLREAQSLVKGDPNDPERRTTLLPSHAITAATAKRVGEYVYLHCKGYEAHWRPDGNALALVQLHRPVRLTNCSTFTELPDQGIGKRVTHFAFSAVPRVFAYSDGDQVIIVDESESRRVTIEAGRTETSISFSPDGKYIVTGHYGREVRMWAVKDGAPVRTFKVTGHEGGLTTKFSPDGAILVVGNRNDTTHLFESMTGKLIRVLDKRMSHKFEFSPAGEILAIAYVDGTIGLWDVNTGKLIRTLNSRGREAFALCWSPNGEILASGGLDAPIVLWSTKDFGVLRSLPAPERVFYLAFSPDGAMLVSAGNTATQVWGIVD